MQYRRFGRTELQMPVFSCGGMRYQQKWQEIDPGEVDPDGQANLEATIYRALELGINHIETARGYGSSEMQLGFLLPKLDRDSFIIQTKIAPYEDSKEFLDNFETSMSQLQLDHLDLLTIHGINTEDLFEWTVKKGGCLDTVRQLQKDSRVGHVGFSTHAPLDIILDTIHVDQQGFDYINLHWYYIFQRNWPAIEAAAQRDMGVFIISPSDKGGKLYAPPDKLRKLCEPLHPMTFNDLFCLSHPQVHTLSIGAARPSDFNEHVDALKYFDQADEILRPITQRLEAAMRQATGNASPEAHLWSLPDYRRTPGGLNVPMILWMGRLALGWDMLDFARMRYNMFGNASHWLSGQQVTALKPEDHAAFVALFSDAPFADLLIDLLNDTHDLLAEKPKQRISQS